MTDTNPTVFVVDDEEHARDSVCALVRTMGVAAEAHESGETFLDRYDGRPGCLVVDYRMAGMNGLELQDALLRIGCHLPVIVVTAYARTPITVQAIQNGAVTLLDKPYQDDDLWQAIRTGITQDEQRRLKEQEITEVQARLAALSDKEHEVLDLIVSGKPNKTMASLLDVSLRTIENRRRRVFNKLSVDTVAELVTLVLRTPDSTSNGTQPNLAVDELSNHKT